MSDYEDDFFEEELSPTKGDIPSQKDANKASGGRGAFASDDDDNVANNSQRAGSLSHNNNNKANTSAIEGSGSVGGDANRSRSVNRNGSDSASAGGQSWLSPTERKRFGSNVVTPEPTEGFGGFRRDSNSNNKDDDDNNVSNVRSRSHSSHSSRHTSASASRRSSRHTSRSRSKKSSRAPSSRSRSHSRSSSRASSSRHSSAASSPRGEAAKATLKPADNAEGEKEEEPPAKISRRSSRHSSRPLSPSSSSSASSRASSCPSVAPTPRDTDDAKTAEEEKETTKGTIANNYDEPQLVQSILIDSASSHAHAQPRRDSSRAPSANAATRRTSSTGRGASQSKQQVHGKGLLSTKAPPPHVLRTLSPQQQQMQKKTSPSPSRPREGSVPLAAVAKKGKAGSPPAAPQITRRDLGMLKLRNAELKAAADTISEQLAALVGTGGGKGGGAAKQLGPVRKTNSAGDADSRTAKLRSEVAALEKENETLLARLRSADVMGSGIEKHIAAREADIKEIRTRNKWLEGEIRKNAKRLKNGDKLTFQQQRAQLADALRKEKQIAQVVLDKATREAEQSVSGREQAEAVVGQLLARDPCPDAFRPQDAKAVIDLRARIGEKIEALKGLRVRQRHAANNAAAVAVSDEAAKASAASLDEELEAMRRQVDALRATVNEGLVRRGGNVLAAPSSSNTNTNSSVSPNVNAGTASAAAAAVTAANNSGGAAPSVAPSVAMPRHGRRSDLDATNGSSVLDTTNTSITSISRGLGIGPRRRDISPQKAPTGAGAIAGVGAKRVPQPKATEADLWTGGGEEGGDTPSKKKPDADKKGVAASRDPSPAAAKKASPSADGGDSNKKKGGAVPINEDPAWLADDANDKNAKAKARSPASRNLAPEGSRSPQQRKGGLSPNPASGLLHDPSKATATAAAWLEERGEAASRTPSKKKEAEVEKEKSAPPSAPASSRASPTPQSSRHSTPRSSRASSPAAAVAAKNSVGSSRHSSRSHSNASNASDKDEAESKKKEDEEKAKLAEIEEAIKRREEAEKEARRKEDERERLAEEAADKAAKERFLAAESEEKRRREAEAAKEKRRKEEEEAEKKRAEEAAEKKRREQEETERRQREEDEERERKRKEEAVPSWEVPDWMKDSAPAAAAHITPAPKVEEKPRTPTPPPPKKVVEDEEPDWLKD